MKKTTNMRAGFTMIELIFVIVIIGVLAAIAMNKLSATRDDAAISKVIANAKTITNDAKAFYTAQGFNKWTGNGTAAATIGDVTDVPLFNATCGAEAISTPIIGTHYICANKNTIVKIDANATHITVSDTNGTDTVSTAVKNNATFKAIAKSMRLGGTGVNFGN